MQAQGIFELPPATEQTLEWHIDLDLPEQWNVGAIVGASGSGKSTIARDLAKAFGSKLIEGQDARGNLAEPFEWDRNKAIASHTALPIKQWLEFLSRVGFSSPPAWCRPYQVLSNGQKFRANLARAIAESQLPVVGGQLPEKNKEEKPKPVFFDEFASLVHDQVAAIASAAVSKSIRKLNKQFVAVTWRTDILNPLEPDWVIFVNDDQTVRLELNNKTADGKSRRWVRPRVKLRIIRVDPSAWDCFKGHHYLSRDIHHSAKCFVGLVNGEPAAFTAVLHFPHPKICSWREHRTLCLPDFQGVGIGNAMSEAVAEMFAGKDGKRYTSVTSHPAMIHHRARSPKWKMLRKPGIVRMCKTDDEQCKQLVNTAAIDRITASFEYVGGGEKNDGASSLIG